SIFQETVVNVIIGSSVAKSRNICITIIRSPGSYQIRAFIELSEFSTSCSHQRLIIPVKSPDISHKVELSRKEKVFVFCIKPEPSLINWEECFSGMYTV